MSCSYVASTTTTVVPVDPLLFVFSQQTTTAYSYSFLEKVGGPCPGVGRDETSPFFSPPTHTHYTHVNQSTGVVTSWSTVGMTDHAPHSFLVLPRKPSGSPADMPFSQEEPIPISFVGTPAAAAAAVDGKAHWTN